MPLLEGVFRILSDLPQVIVTDLVALRDVGKYLSITAIVWAIADVAGPLLGGAFSQHVKFLS